MKMLSLALIGITQGLICFECDNAKNMDECKAQRKPRECNENENSCQQEIRSWGPGGKFMSITQRCKQKHACVNNHIQNPRAAWKDTQCQPFTHPENSVCRCCCDWNYCNGKEYAGCRGLAYWKTTTETPPANTTTTTSTTAPTITTTPLITSPSDGEGEATTTADFNIVTDLPPATEAPETTEGPTCEWTIWTEWDKCSETCGGGQRNRYRNPTGDINAAGCEGFAEDVEYCNTQDCETKQCKDNYVDVCFLLPVHNATDNKSVRLMRNFVRETHNYIGNFGSEDLQFCVYQYSESAANVFSLSESADFDSLDLKTALEQGIEIPEDRGANIGAAFKTIHDEGFNAINGWRKNDQIPSVLIVLTDNLNTVDFYEDLQYVHNKAYRVVAVGIGENVENSSLSSIASLPSDENVFTVRDFTELSNVVDEVGYDICQVDYWKEDQCMYQNGGCTAQQTCYVQYNGKQCYDNVLA